MPQPNQPNQRRQQALLDQRKSRAGYDFSIVGKKHLASGTSTFDIEMNAFSAEDKSHI